MKVLVVYGTDFRHHSPGGIQSFIREVGRSRPPDLDVCYVGVGGAAGPLPHPDDEFVSVLPHPCASRSLNGQFVRALRDRRSMLRQADIVIIHRAEHILAIPPGVRPVVTLHGGPTFAWLSGRRRFGAVYPAIEAYAMARATAVLSVVPDRHVLSKLKSVVPVSTSFDPDLWWAEEPPTLEPRLLVAARLVPEKRVEIALGVAALLGWPITVLGDGPCRQRLEETARRLGVNATFTGQVSADSLRDVYAASPGVLLMTSVFEGFPAAAVEAAAAGLGLVGLAAPGVSDAFGRLGGQVAADAQVAAAQAADLVAGTRERPGRDRIWGYRSSEVASHFWEAVLDATP